MTLPPDTLWLALAAGVLTAAAMPAWHRLCRLGGWVDQPGDRKIHQHAVPLAGGIAVLSSLLAVTAWASGHGWAAFSVYLGPPASAVPLASAVRPVLLGASAMMLVGLLDDWRELRPAWKLAGQILAGLLAVALLPSRPEALGPAWISLPLSLVFLLTLTNACNFTDNMNGLCAGLGLIGALGLGLLASHRGDPVSCPLALVTAAALAGFLPWNFPRGRVFLGDSGSHLVGCLLALLVLLAARSGYARTTPHGDWIFWVRCGLIPLSFVALPLLDLVVVVLWRWRAGRPVYVGDNNHFSHRLVRAGLSRSQAVALLWLAAALVGALALGADHLLHQQSIHEPPVPARPALSAPAP